MKQPCKYLQLGQIYILALRPRQWTKNLVVFAAPLFAFSISWQSFIVAFFALILFCTVSSSFYLINDIFDVNSDRQHPVKCHRPIASGLISVPNASMLAGFLLITAIGLSWWRSPQLGFIITAYAGLQISYNLRLKRVVILDIGVIAIGFVLRALAGAAATNIKLSSWFILCTAMLALFLAIEKRKAELRLTQISYAKPRAVLKRYSLDLLSRMESVVTTSTIVTYMLWSAGPNLNGASTPWMLVTLPFVFYGIFRYQLLSDTQEITSSGDDLEKGGHTERPEEVLLKDIPLFVKVISWIVTCFVVLWLKKEGLIK